MFTYRSIQVGGLWTTQRYWTDGSSFLHHFIAAHQPLAGGQGGNGAMSGKEVADSIGQALADATGGTFDTSIDPFEV